MHREEIKEVLDWTLAYEDQLDWAAPEWEDQYEDYAFSVLQKEALENCGPEVVSNRKCMEEHNVQYLCQQTYDTAIACVDKYLNFKRWEEVRRDIIKSKQVAVTEVTGLTKAPPSMFEMKPNAYHSPGQPPNPGRVRKCGDAFSSSELPQVSRS